MAMDTQKMDSTMANHLRKYSRTKGLKKHPREKEIYWEIAWED